MRTPGLALLVVAIEASCGPPRPATTEGRVVQDVTADEVVLSLELGPPSRAAAATPASSAAQPPAVSEIRDPPPAPTKSDQGYGYNFDEDPLSAADCPNNAECRPKPATGPTSECPEWSRCEVTRELELNEFLFNPCWRRAFAPSAPATSTITFTARATIDRDGHVRDVAIEHLAPDAHGVAACLSHAFQQIPFPLEVVDTTTRLVVPIRLSAP